MELSSRKKEGLKNFTPPNLLICLLQIYPNTLKLPLSSISSIKGSHNPTSLLGMTGLVRLQVAAIHYAKEVGMPQSEKKKLFLSVN